MPRPSARPASHSLPIDPFPPTPSSATPSSAAWRERQASAFPGARRPPSLPRQPHSEFAHTAPHLRRRARALKPYPPPSPLRLCTGVDGARRRRCALGRVENDAVRATRCPALLGQRAMDARDPSLLPLQAWACPHSPSGSLRGRTGTRPVFSTAPLLQWGRKGRGRTRGQPPWDTGSPLAMGPGLQARRKTSRSGWRWTMRQWCCWQWALPGPQFRPRQPWTASCAERAQRAPWRDAASSSSPPPQPPLAWPMHGPHWARSLGVGRATTDASHPAARPRKRWSPSAPLPPYGAIRKVCPSPPCSPAAKSSSTTAAAAPALRQRAQAYPRSFSPALPTSPPALAYWRVPVLPLWSPGLPSPHAPPPKPCSSAWAPQWPQRAGPPPPPPPPTWQCESATSPTVLLQRPLPCAALCTPGHAAAGGPTRQLRAALRASTGSKPPSPALRSTSRLAAGPRRCVSTWRAGLRQRVPTWRRRPRWAACTGASAWLLP